MEGPSVKVSGFSVFGRSHKERRHSVESGDSAFFIQVLVDIRAGAVIKQPHYP